MLRRWLPLAGVVLAVAAVIAAVVAGLSAPRLVAVSPGDGEEVPVGAAQVRLTFSRPVEQASLAAHVRFAPDVPGSWAVEGNTATFTPSQPWQSGESVTVTVARGVKAANGLPLLQGLTWSFHIMPTMLAYISPPEDGNIYTVSVDASGVPAAPQPMTTVGGVRAFAPSADGRFVYFSARRGLGVSLFVLERTESSYQAEPGLLLDCGNDQCLAPLPSPDGHWLAYTRSDAPGGGTRVHLLRLEDRTDAVIAPPDDVTWGAVWSPQGMLAYYDATRGGYVAVAPESGGEAAFVPNDVGESAAWTPDGHGLVVVAMKEIDVSVSAGTPQAPSEAPYLAAHLWLYRFAPEPAHTDLTRDPALEDASPVFSPNGAWLAFARKALDPLHWTPGRQLWVMRPDGSDAMQITHAPDYNHLDFAWHPTASLLAFARTNQADLTRPPEVWVYDFQRQQAYLIAANALMPRWLP